MLRAYIIRKAGGHVARILREADDYATAATIMAMPAKARHDTMAGLIGQRTQAAAETACRIQGLSKRQARRLIALPKAARQLAAVSLTLGHRLDGGDLVQPAHRAGIASPAEVALLRV